MPDEAIVRIMLEYGLDEDTAARVLELMDEGVDEDEAIQLAEEGL